MLMKPFVPRPNRKAVSRTAARNAALVNQFATPGLGSLMAGRWMAGIGQLLVFLTGCGMIIMYFFQLDLHAYGEATGKFEPEPSKRLGEIGLILFVGGWFWALVTSLSLVIRAKPEEPAIPQTDSSPTANLSAVPPKLTE
jgi:hypothetical protein